MGLYIFKRVAVFRVGFRVLFVLLCLMLFLSWKGKSTLTGVIFKDVFQDKKTTVDLKDAMNLVKKKAVRSADRKIPYIGPLTDVDNPELADAFDRADKYVGKEKKEYWGKLFEKNEHSPEIAFNYGVTLAKNDYPRLALRVLKKLRLKLNKGGGDGNLKLLVFVNHNIGLIYRKLGDHKQSIQYFREVIGKFRILRKEVPFLQYEPIQYGNMKHEPLDAYLYLCKAYEMSEPSRGTLQQPGDMNKYEKFHGLLYEGYKQKKWKSNLVWMADNYRLLCENDYNVHEPRLHLALGRLALKTKHFDYAEEFLNDAKRYCDDGSRDVTNRISETLAIVYFLTDRYKQAMAELSQLNDWDKSGKSENFVRTLFACMREGKKVECLNQWPKVWSFFSTWIKRQKSENNKNTLEKLRSKIFEAAELRHIDMIADVAGLQGVGALIAVENKFGKTDTLPEIKTMISRMVKKVLEGFGPDQITMYWVAKHTKFFRLASGVILIVMVGWTLLVFFSHWLHFTKNIASSGFQKDVNIFNKNKEKGEDYKSLVDLQTKLVLDKYQQRG